MAIFESHWRFSRSVSWASGFFGWLAYVNEQQDLSAPVGAALAKIRHKKKVPDLGRTTWVTPKIVAQVKFSEWTAAGEMRHPVFVGLRTDKKAPEVFREVPVPLHRARRVGPSRRM